MFFIPSGLPQVRPQTLFAAASTCPHTPSPTATIPADSVTFGAHKKVPALRPNTVQFGETWDKSWEMSGYDGLVRAFAERFEVFGISLAPHIGQTMAIAGVTPADLKETLLPAILTHTELREHKTADGYTLLKLLQYSLDSGQIIRLIGAEDDNKIRRNMAMAHEYLDNNVSDDIREIAEETGINPDELAEIARAYKSSQPANSHIAAGIKLLREKLEEKGYAEITARNALMRFSMLQPSPPKKRWWMK